MTVQHTPAPARSDVAPAAPPPRPPRPYRVQGTMLTVGAAGLGGVPGGVRHRPERQRPGPGHRRLGSGLFQVGLLGLLVVLYRSQALGTGRLARFFLRAEAVLVTFAIGSTIADAVRVSDLDQPGWAMLDAFWPFSMMGMFAIAHPDRDRRPLAGRGPLLAAGGRELGARGHPDHGHLRRRPRPTVVSIVHLCVGYAVLGQIVARKQD